jgi:hypothetical protein
MNLANFCVRLLWRQKLERHWRWSTLQRNMAALAGACAVLPLYARNAAPILLSRYPEWSAATRAAKYRAVTEAPTQATPASTEEALRAVNIAILNNDRTTAEIIAMTWATAARVGCTTQLKGEDLGAVTPAQDRALVTFRRGKGVMMRKQAYTVAINMGQFAEVLRRVFARALLRPTDFLWPSVSQAERTKLGVSVRVMLRLVDPRLEQRSLRRGALRDQGELQQRRLRSGLLSRQRRFQLWPPFRWRR